MIGAVVFLGFLLLFVLGFGIIIFQVMTPDDAGLSGDYIDAADELSSTPFADELLKELLVKRKSCD
mgnify:CR=1 FL=1